MLVILNDFCRIFPQDIHNDTIDCYNSVYCGFGKCVLNSSAQLTIFERIQAVCHSPNTQISIVKTESDPTEYGRPMILHSPTTKIKMVDVVIFEPFWVTGLREVNSDEWWQKCIYLLPFFLHFFFKLK